MQSAIATARAGRGYPVMVFSVVVALYADRHTSDSVTQFYCFSIGVDRELMPALRQYAAAKRETSLAVLSMWATRIFLRIRVAGGFTRLTGRLHVP
jgi:hypothetical protein